MSANNDIPFLDLKSMHKPLLADIQRAVADVIDSHAFALGPAVQAFENDFARTCDAAECVGLNSGTSAVHIALLCAGVQPGDEVITTPLTWISTSWAISYIGAKPVYVDVDPETYCLNAQHIETALTHKTSAILPVHLYGHPADMDAIIECADANRLPVVEDAAQAHGARYRSKPCGALGSIAAFSFYPGKNLGAFGEGGAVTTNNQTWAERARSLRDHAQQGRHNHTEIGYNYRLEGIQGAVLRVKLQHLEQWNSQRRQVAQWYHERLRDITDVKAPMPAPWADPVWHIFAIQHPKRDQLQAHLAKAGIQSGIHYPVPVHLQPAYADLGYKVGDFPVAESIASQVLSLPMYPGMPLEAVDRVCETIRSFAG